VPGGASPGDHVGDGSAGKHTPGRRVGGGGCGMFDGNGLQAFFKEIVAEENRVFFVPYTNNTLSTSNRSHCVFMIERDHGYKPRDITLTSVVIIARLCKNC